MSDNEQDRWLDALSDFPADGPWPEADQHMLIYALKLTQSPASIREKDVDRLRQHGFDDRAIHDICTVAAYFGFVNRIANGLGVELES